MNIKELEKKDKAGDIARYGTTVIIKNEMPKDQSVKERKGGG